MATVGIWGVKNNLVRVIDYVSNEDKTTEVLKDLHNEIDYISVITDKNLLSFMFFPLVQLWPSVLKHRQLLSDIFFLF